MKILAIDTSNKPLSVAVMEDEHLLCQATYIVARNHSDKLLPLITELLKQAQIKPNELDRIAIAKGPGSYTGLRIGATTAKTLAYTLKKELVAVSSLEVLAQAYPANEDQVLVPVFDARRENVFAGAYQYNEQHELVNVLADQHISVSDLCAQLKDKKVVLMGDAAVYADKFTQLLTNYNFAPVNFNYPHADVLALLGEKKAPVDVNEFVPAYLRLTQAEMQWLEKHPERRDYHESYVEKV